jgi:hypothetical protein
MSWGDGTGVPTSANNLVIAGTDSNNLLHIRVFDRDGRRVTDTDETKLPPEQARAILVLKQQLWLLKLPHALTFAEKECVLIEVRSIAGQNLSGYAISQLKDSKGRGAIRYLDEGNGRRVRIDSFVIPLVEIGKRPGETIRFAYWGDSPHPAMTVNSVGYRDRGRYYPYHLPRETFHSLTLSDRPPTLDVARVPEERDDPRPLPKQESEPISAPAIPAHGTTHPVPAGGAYTPLPAGGAYTPGD